MTGEWLGLLTIALVCGLAVAIVAVAQWLDRGASVTGEEVAAMDGGGVGPPPADVRIFRQRQGGAERRARYQVVEMDPNDYVRRDVYEVERAAAQDDIKSVLTAVVKLTGSIERLENEFHRYQLENRDRESGTNRRIYSQRTQLDDRLLQWLILVIIAIITLLGPHMAFH